ncbi:LysE family transporter [Sphingobacterium sp. MYb382]|uniref:LysE family transporter n=1 Tax=Sphingobacterium sp. MYb382 TaxID=2745278 RepID=UPI0030A55616
MWFSFFIYSVLTALLPGPNNILALNSSMKVGYKQSRPLLYGVYGGFTLIMFLSAIFSEVILHTFKDLLLYLKYFGALYLVYLAWSVGSSKAIDMKEIQSGELENRSRKSDFWKGFLLQLVNVKIIIYGITAFSSFIFPHFNNWSITVVFALFLSVVGSGATWIWAIAGEKLSTFLNHHYKVVNTIMALLLVYCAVSLFL